MEFPTLTEEEEKALYATKEKELEDKADTPPDSPPEEAADTAPDSAPEAAADAAPEAVAPEAPPAPEDKGAWAKMSYEKREAEREAKRLREEIEALKAPKKVIPAREENYEGHIEAKIETSEERIARLEAAEKKRQDDAAEQDKYTGALSELKSFETSYAAAAPDYNDASNHLKAMIATSIKLLDPAITPEELAKKTVKTYLTRAAVAMRDGINPAQALYNQALQVGYRKTVKEEAKEEEKNNFAKVAENKKKSAGMIGTGGGSKPNTTAKAAATMSNGEFSRLDPVELERLMYG